MFKSMFKSRKIKELNRKLVDLLVLTDKDVPSQVEELLKQGADPNSFVNGNPLFFYIFNDAKSYSILENMFKKEQLEKMYSDKLETLNILIRYGADLNKTTEDGRETVFNGHYAQYARLPIKELIKRGIDITLKDKEGYNALHRFLRNESRYNEEGLEEIKAMLDAGIDVNETNNRGQTAFSIATTHSFDTSMHFNKIPDIEKKILKTLIEYGADISEKKHVNPVTGEMNIATGLINLPGDLQKELIDYYRYVQINKSVQESDIEMYER